MWQRESRRSGEGKKKKTTPDTFTDESSATSPESGILSYSSKNRRFFRPRSNWLHDCMFHFRCNFKIMATAEEDVNSEFSAALTSSLEDFIHKSLKDEQTECIRRIVCFEKHVLAILPTGDRERRHCLWQC